MSDAISGLSEQEIGELSALADGTLPPERRAEVEARVAASPELLELVERQRRAVRATQALAEEPTPASLVAAVATLRAGRDTRRSRAGRLVPRLAVVGALAAVVAVVAPVVLTGGPGGPAVADAARLASKAPNGPAPPPISSTTLAANVEGVAFPNLARWAGWHTLGVRRGRIGGRDATVVFYGKGGKRLGYVIVAGSGLAMPSGARETTRRGVQYQTLHLNGRPAVTWRRAGHTCVLTGGAPYPELLRLASWPLSFPR